MSSPDQRSDVAVEQEVGGSSPPNCTSPLQSLRAHRTLGFSDIEQGAIGQGAVFATPSLLDRLAREQK